jgi:hypothetical protein
MDPLFFILVKTAMKAVTQFPENHISFIMFQGKVIKDLCYARAAI